MDVLHDVQPFYATNKYFKRKAGDGNESNELHIRHVPVSKGQFTGMYSERWFVSSYTSNLADGLHMPE